MRQYLAGGAAALAMAGAGVLILGRPAAPAASLPAAPAQTAAAEQEAPLPDTVPEASPRTREQKRFGRYDKNKDGSVTREEYLLSRRKAYARLDTNKDGVLQFDEWSAKTLTKFAAADRDKSGAMDAAEFATTAVKRKAPRRAVPCPPAQPAAAEEEG